MAPQWQQNPLLVHMAMNAPFCCNEAFHPPDGNDAPVLRKARARLHAAVMQGKHFVFTERNIIKCPLSNRLLYTVLAFSVDLRYSFSTVSYPYCAFESHLNIVAVRTADLNGICKRSLIFLHVYWLNIFKL